MSVLAEIAALADRHGGFIVAAYGVTALALAALIAHLLLAYRRLKARLAALQARAERNGGRR